MNISKIVRSAKCGVLSALVAMGMTAVAADQEVVQLWAGGPYWATSNLGISEVTEHPEYGALYTFEDAGKAVKAILGEEWRVPSDQDLKDLLDTSKCTMTKVTDNEGKFLGYTFTGATEGYKDKSIFLPAAGYNYGSGRELAGDGGNYWSSTEEDAYDAWYLYFDELGASVNDDDRSFGKSVRAVRDTAPVTGPTVTVDKVTAGDPWSKITVNYTLGGTDAKLEYKVAFDVTAKDQTASVTNDAAKLTDGAATKEIDTLALFGKQVVDTKAKVKVTLIAIKPKDPPPAGQLWKDGPIWAECNVGGTVPGDYGELYTYNDNKAADAAKSLGDGWRLPTDQELKDLLSNCEKNWETCKDSEGADINGYRFTGKGDYSSNSIFLPAAGAGEGGVRRSAGIGGFYWSSEAGVDAGSVWCLNFGPSNADVILTISFFQDMSVRAVRSAE